MKFPLAALSVSVLLSGCAGLGRIESYGSHLADAKVHVDGKGYSIWVHQHEDTLLVQRSAGAAMGQSFVQGLTLNLVNMMDPKPYWKRAAAQMTDPVGCQVTDVYPLDSHSTWEAPYACPAGVDLRALINAQREDLRHGAPIHR